MPVIVKSQALTAGTTCRLYAQPLGVFDVVAVSRESNVEYLDAFVEKWSRYDRDSDDVMRRPWLHIRIDGREGWVTAARALGLPYQK